ncbi:carboxypeptidase regulatory-like domain-containing protein [Methylobacterium radiotolerans]|uniref:carboxypeptidase regulatory-like domain-containing protein n=1 Tax=Methylobacterium radiotolerans TaxID=31998 RepID=UPI0038D1C6B0
MILLRLLLAAALAAYCSSCAGRRFEQSGLGRASFASLESRDKPAPAGKAVPVDGSGAASLAHRVRIDVPFDGNDASRISMPGYTRVVGQGKMVLNIGTLHAQGEVRLVPFTEYAKARYRVLFAGLRCFTDPDKFVETDPRYGNYLRRAMIGQDGSFAFDKVYPGRYWVEATFENANVLDKEYRPQTCISIGSVEVPDGGDAVVDFSAGPGI